MNAAWQQRTRLTYCNAHSSHTPRTPLHLERPSRVQRYSSSMHRAMKKDSLMIRHDDEYEVCENYVGSVYVGEYRGLCESGCRMLIVVIMGKWSDDSAC